MKALGYGSLPIAAHYLKVVLAITLLGIARRRLLHDRDDNGASTFLRFYLDNRELRDDWSMRGSRRADMPREADEFVAKCLVVHADGPQAAMQRLACENEHLVTAVMKNAPPAGRRSSSAWLVRRIADRKYPSAQRPTDFAQVHVDDDHRIGVGRLDTRKQDWPIE